MAEVLVQFTEPLAGPGGKRYIPRICGREAEDGLWDGWIEFVSDDGSAVLRSRRETRQPNRDDLMYWATGLTQVYLEGALERTLAPPPSPPRAVEVEPAYEGPAPDLPTASAAAAARARTVLDPFDVYAQGEDILRQELTALNAARLRDIARAHALLEQDDAELSLLSRAELAERMVAAVRRRVEAAADG